MPDEKADAPTPATRNDESGEARAPVTREALYEEVWAAPMIRTR